MTRIVGIYGCWYDRQPGEQIKGCGKTLTGCYYLNSDYHEGKVCYSNTPTNFTTDMSTHEVYEMLTDKDVRNVGILLDEIQKDINSIGCDNSFIKDFCNKAAAQTRKKGVELYWTAQRAYDVHLRLRVQTDVFLRPVRMHKNKILCNREDCPEEHFIAVYDVTDGIPKRPIVYLDCKAVGELYDTNHVLTDSMQGDE